MIGIGSGFSMDLIKRGAAAGEGHYLAIINIGNIAAKIIGLLEGIVKPKLENFGIVDSKGMFSKEESKIPEKLSKGRPNSIYLQYNEKANAKELLSS